MPPPLPPPLPGSDRGARALRDGTGRTNGGVLSRPLERAYQGAVDHVLRDRVATDGPHRVIRWNEYLPLHDPDGNVHPGQAQVDLAFFSERRTGMQVDE
jgi:hypothetical protein